MRKEEKMFFVFGISNKEKEIDFSQTIVCEVCGAYGRLEAFMRYSYFSLFFIPILKWNKKYYIRSTCCNSLYTIDKDLGKDIEKGFIERIDESKLKSVNVNHNRTRYCNNCSYPVELEFEYCPKCGSKI
ncbi:MAG TPA: zinc ribbon domain-containing protein [Tissierellaceae bacterium]|nr:zinc ribbon domain-containing protein [Tissierellaceae bacterium]